MCDNTVMTFLAWAFGGWLITATVAVAALGYILVRYAIRELYRSMPEWQLTAQLAWLSKQPLPHDEHDAQTYFNRILRAAFYARSAELIREELARREKEKHHDRPE